MKTTLPTSKDIEELISFLPHLYKEGFASIRDWGGGTKGEDGILTVPWPEYDPIVKEFFRVASGKCWRDDAYRSEEAGRMLENENAVNWYDPASMGPRSRDLGEAAAAFVPGERMTASMGPRSRDLGEVDLSESMAYTATRFNGAEVT